MGFKLNRNYSVEFVRILGGKPNNVIISPSGSHKKSNKWMEYFENKMKQKLLEQREKENDHHHGEFASEEDNIRFVPHVNDMVLVASSEWSGVRRAIVLKILHSSEDCVRCSLYLYDYGKNYVCYQNDLSPIPNEFVRERPSVYKITLEHVFPTVVYPKENKIEWTTGTTDIMEKWLSKPDYQLCMNISYAKSHYEFIGDLIHYTSNFEGTVKHPMTLVNFMLFHMVACILPQYQDLLRLLTNDVTDSTTLPKILNNNGEVSIRNSNDKHFDSVEYDSDESNAPIKTDQKEDDPLSCTQMPKTPMKYAMPGMRNLGDATMSFVRPANPSKEAPKEMARQKMMLEWGAEKSLLEENVDLLVDVMYNSNSDNSETSLSTDYPHSRSSISSD